MFSEFLLRLLGAQLDLGFGKPVLWREIIGNGFGLASAVLGMSRRVAAWPIGIIGNIILFTVFLGGVFHTPQDLNLWGQAGRQVFFFAISLFGWAQWARYRRQHAGEADSAGVQPRWAGRRERLILLGSAVVLFVAFDLVLRQLHSFGPAADAWILTGSVLATYGMAKGYVEFWLIWIAVDVVGVPLLFVAGYYPSGLMYVVYGVFCAIGFVSWWRLQRRQAADAKPELVTAD